MTRYFLILLALPVALAACTDGIKVGPYPVALAVGDGVLAPDELPVAPGKFGVFTVELPVCDIPSRAEIDAVVASGLPSAIAPIFTLTELNIAEFVLTANEGSFAGVTSVTAYLTPAGQDKGFLGGTRLGTSASIKGHGEEVVLNPPGEVNVLNLLPGEDALDCPTITFIVTGIAPDTAIAWQGDLFLDAYGELTSPF